MAWIYLIIAGLFEVGFASTLKLTQGFTKLGPTLIFLTCAVASFLLLACAARATCLSVRPTWCGPGSARAEPRFSASFFIRSPRRR
jgi:quaternary ammonium compound-resistance protein SugE